MEQELSNQCDQSSQDSLFQDESASSTLQEPETKDEKTIPKPEVLIEEENARSGFESTDTSSNFNSENTSESKPKDSIKTDFTDQNLVLSRKNESQDGKYIKSAENEATKYSAANETTDRVTKQDDVSNSTKDLEIEETETATETASNDVLKLEDESMSMEVDRPIVMGVEGEVSACSEDIGLKVLDEKDVSMLDDVNDNSQESFIAEETKEDFSSQDVSLDCDPKTEAKFEEPKKKLEVPKVPVEEDSVSSVASLRSLKRRWIGDESNAAIVKITVENIFEYQWPQEQNADYYMVQELVSEFLGAKSFKRKYPDLFRRSVEIHEREFLKENFTIPETLCDLGLTAIRSEEVIELMAKDYPEKYQEYDGVIQEREKQKQLAARKSYSTQPAPDDKAKMSEIIKMAVQSAAEYNTKFNQDRREERRCCIDMQNFTVNYPTRKLTKYDNETPAKTLKYPLALIPRQFQDYYKSYTPNELKYLPINTAVFGPPPAIHSARMSDVTSDESGSESDDSSSSSGSSSSEDSQAMSTASTASSKSNNKKASGTPKTDVKVAKSANEAFECKVCHKAESDPLLLVQCCDCNSRGHPDCLDLTDAMVAITKTYKWQCMECKTCVHCRDPYDEDKMMFCDKCDRGYHTFCVGMRNIPSGRWICKSCGQCAVCGAQKPSPEGSSRAQWQNEYAKNKNGEMEIVRTLCILCAKPHRRKSAAGATGTPLATM